MRFPDDLILKDSTLKDQYFDLKGLSAYSSLSVSTLRDHIRSSGLPHYAVHGTILVKKSEYDRWVSGYRGNRTQDLGQVADEVLAEIGLLCRRS